jgi:hypothetical protein
MTKGSIFVIFSGAVPTRMRAISGDCANTDESPLAVTASAHPDLKRSRRLIFRQFSARRRRHLPDAPSQ